MLGTILLTAINAVFPIVLTILLGYLLRRSGFLNDAFIKTGNKLVFRVCLPCVLFSNVYSMSAAQTIDWGVVLYCTAAVLGLFLLGMAVAVATTREGSRRGGIWQCCFRSNYAIIGTSLSMALGGESAMVVSSAILALTVPLFNVFSVIALEVFTEDKPGHRNSPGHMLIDILKNPLIIAVVLGAVCLGIRSLQEQLFGKVVFSLSRDTAFLFSVINSIKSMATPLALLVLGGQFQFSVVRGMFKEIAVSTVFRIVIAPVLGLGVALLLDRYTNLLSCNTETIPAMLALFGSPVAVSSAVMAAEMHNDKQLAAQLVVWTSIGSAFTLFLMVCVLMSMGLLAV